MSIPAMFFGDKFCMNWGWWVGTPKEWKQHGFFWAGLWESLGRAISLILSTNEPRKQSSYLIGPPCSVQGQFISYSWLVLPEQVNDKCTYATLYAAWSRKTRYGCKL